MSVPLAYFNGRLLPRDDVHLPIHDAGLVFGATVTDFCRTFRQRLFRWADHLARFRNDCAVCYIPLTPDDTELTSIAHELVSHNARLIEPEEELALISFASPGPYGFYAGTPGQNGPPTLCLHTLPLSFAGYRWFFENGVALEVAGIHAAPANDLAPPAVKHRSRLHWWRADRLLASVRPHAANPVLALLEDGAGHVTETAIGNLLIVRDGRVLTPPRGQVLHGISLRVVKDICDSLDIPFVEQPLTLADCTGASEAMLCGSAFCLAGVRRLQGHDIPWPGPTTLRLLAAWSERVGIDIVAQILSTR